MLADIFIVNARTLIHDPTTGPLEALAVQAMILKPFVKIMRIAVDIVHEHRMDGPDQDVRRFCTRLIEGILIQAEAMEPKDQEYLLDLIK